MIEAVSQPQFKEREIFSKHCPQFTWSSKLAVKLDFAKERENFNRVFSVGIGGYFDEICAVCLDLSCMTSAFYTGRNHPQFCAVCLHNSYS